jgi:hypothetical protein
MATFDQFYAESGRQSELDQLRASGLYDQAKAKWEAGGGGGSGGSTTTNTFSPSSGGNTLSAQYGGNFDRYMAETGKQSTLDQIRSTPGGYEKARDEWLSGNLLPVLVLPVLQGFQCQPCQQ